jgi:hypothetical protein
MHGRSSLIQEKRLAQFAAKGRARFRIPLENFYSGKRKRTSARCKKLSRASNLARLSKILLLSRETFATGSSSIRVQLDTGLFNGEIQKKPRGGSRGVMTRSLSGR